MASILTMGTDAKEDFIINKRVEIVSKLKED